MTLQLIKIEDGIAKGEVLYHPLKRRGVFKLHYASRLRLEHNLEVNSRKSTCSSPMKNSHTIKLKRIKPLYENFSQGTRKLSDRERLVQLAQNQQKSSS